MISYIRPQLGFFEAWADCISEFELGEIHGSSGWQLTDFGPDRTTYDAVVEFARQEADTTVPLPPERVPCDTYWIWDEDESTIIGFLSVRHSLDTDFLRTQGGHIGYSVRPSRRRRGHAGRALDFGLDRVRELGLDRVLLTCDDHNLASARTIESRGGVYEGLAGVRRQYWISL